MEKLRAKLNNSFDFKKLIELEINKKYQASNFQFLDTKHGKRITVVLDNNFKIFLPEGFLKKIEKSDLKLLNENSQYITYKGLEDIGNNKTKHKIEFC